MDIFRTPEESNSVANISPLHRVSFNDILQFNNTYFGDLFQHKRTNNEVYFDLLPFSISYVNREYNLSVVKNWKLGFKWVLYSLDDILDNMFFFYMDYILLLLMINAFYSDFP